VYLLSLVLPASLDDPPGLETRSYGLGSPMKVTIEPVRKEGGRNHGFCVLSGAS